MSKLNITLENASNVIELDTGYIIAKAGFSLEDVAEEIAENIANTSVEGAEETPQPEPEELSPFKIGDRVRVTTDKYGELQQGDIGFVTAIFPERVRYKVDVDFTKAGSRRKQPAAENDYTFGDLEVIKGFIVGDKVKVSEADKASNICGKVGTITEDDGSGFFQFRVETDGDYDWQQPSDLTFA